MKKSDDEINLRNIEGKCLLEKSLLEYSREIVKELKNDLSLLPILLEKLKVNEKEFYSLISLEKVGNITFYDESLQLLKKEISDTRNKL